MGVRHWLAAAVIVPVAAGLVRESTSTAATPAATGQESTTLDDQAELAVTVYNSDIALVRDVRNLQLARGQLRSAVHGHRGDGESGDGAFPLAHRAVARSSVLEQNYEYDLLEPDKLLRKYVGRDVTLVRTRQDGGTTRQEEVKARLLSYNNAPVWQIGGEIVTGLHADHIRFPELPGQSATRVRR